MGDSARIAPFCIIAAQLYNLFWHLTGRPRAVSISSPLVSSKIRASARSAPSSRVGCKNRSPQVYPVTHSSGRASTFTPCAAASSIRAMICPALYSQSATRIFGVPAAAFTKPSRIRPASLKL